MAPCRSLAWVHGSYRRLSAFRVRTRGLGMIIVLNCPGCKKAYELDGALAGKKSRCKGCGEVFRIPVPTGRVVGPAASPTPPAAPSAQPSWVATPVAELLDGDPVVGRTPRTPARGASPASRPPARNGGAGTAMPPPVARPKPAPAPSEFDHDLPPPPRMPYQPARRPSRSRSEDTELGVTAFGWFFLLEILLSIGLYLYFTIVESDPMRAGRIYAIESGITLLISVVLSLWGSCWLLSLAFREDVMRGVFCLVVPFYAFIFAASRWQERRGTVSLMLAYPLALVFTLSLAWFAFPAVRDKLVPPSAPAPGFANDDVPQGNAVQPNPAPVPPAPAARSKIKADAYQVRLAEQTIRNNLAALKVITAQLSKIHNVESARQIRFVGMFPRIRVRRPRNLDLGPNEILALKHRVGPEIRSAFSDFKNQVLRVQSIPGLGAGLDAADLAEIDALIDLWSIKPGEEEMPELIEPPQQPKANRFGPPGFRGGFPPGGPGGFPPDVFPAGPPMGMSSDIVEQMERDYQAMRQAYGEKAAAILVTGLPMGGDPSTREVTEAISKRIKELAPETATGRAATIGDRFETVVAPVNDIQALAIGIDFGAVTVKGSHIEVKLDAKWAAKVPRLPAEPKPGPSAAPSRPDEPEIPPGADIITRSMIELKSADRGKRRQALDRLQRAVPDGRVDQVVGELVPMLDDDDGFFVTEVVKTLAVWRSPEAMTALIGRMRENRHFVRSEAIKALGKYRDPRAAEAIVPLMKEDGFAAEDALKAMGDVAEPVLIPILHDADPGLRRDACKILAQIGGQKTLMEMQSMPADPDGLVRMAAQDAWKQIVARVGPPPKPVRGKAAAGR
jgi:hypothetical protein